MFGRAPVARLFNSSAQTTTCRKICLSLWHSVILNYLIAMPKLQPLTIYRAASPIHSPEAVERAHSELLAALRDVFEITILPIEQMPSAAECHNLYGHRRCGRVRKPAVGSRQSPASHTPCRRLAELTGGLTGDRRMA